MTCKLWIEKAFPFTEGLLPEAERRAYEAHLTGCPTCRGEVEASRGLGAALAALEPPAMAPGAAIAFEARVLARVRAAARETSAAREAVAVREAAAAREGAARAAAARAIAARSRERGRPVFAPLPSPLLVSLGVAAGALATLLFAGDQLVRGAALGLGLALAHSTSRAVWLAERVGLEIVELLALVRVLGRLTPDAGPWFDALRQFLVVRSGDLALAGVLIIALLGWLGLAERHQRIRLRRASRP